jgi:hypothetical protein
MLRKRASTSPYHLGSRVGALAHRAAPRDLPFSNTLCQKVRQQILLGPASFEDHSPQVLIELDWRSETDQASQHIIDRGGLERRLVGPERGQFRNGHGRYTA